MRRRVYVIGHPIGHSISPAMHNAAFSACGIDAEYMAVDVLPNQLAHWLDDLRHSDSYGCNVTIPHKQAVAQLVDQVTGDATLARAVNTVIHDPGDRGRLLGSNTDTFGFRTALAQEAGASLANQHVLLIGAGGAARAIAIVAIQDGAAELTIANRTLERATDLRDTLRSHGNTCPVRPIALEDRGAIAASLADATVVVNATSVGLRSQETPIDRALIQSAMHAACIVMDIVYSPADTAFLQAAKQAGARTVGGLGMLVYQAAAAFEAWTGLPAPVAPMRAAAEHALQPKT